MATKKQTKKQPEAAEKSVTKKQGGPRPNSGGAREGAGRPAFVPTESERKQVEALSGYGLPIEQIAVLVRGGIDTDTLRKHFATELTAGKAKANSGVGRTLFQKAMGGDTAAMIWWSKTQMRWAETQKHEVTGADGAPLEFREIKRVVVKA
jgi:hypothetical protein